MATSAWSTSGGSSLTRPGTRPVNEPVIGSPENRPEATSEQIDACFRETYDYFRLPPHERQN